MTHDLIGTAEAASILHWSTRTVSRKAKAGEIPHAVKLPSATGAYLFRRADIEQMAEGVA